MLKNRVQIGRLGGVDGLVGNAGNLEFDAQVDIFLCHSCHNAVVCGGGLAQSVMSLVTSTATKLVKAGPG